MLELKEVYAIVDIEDEKGMCKNSSSLYYVYVCVV